jgi:hypothetical protein
MCIVQCGAVPSMPFFVWRYLRSLGLENERDSVPGAILGTFYIGGMKQGRLKVKRGTLYLRTKSLEKDL